MLESVLITLQSWHLIWGTSAKDCFCTAHAPLTVTHPFYFMFSIFLIITVLLRSIHPEVFYEKSALRNFEKFTGKHLCQSLFFNKVAGLRPVSLLKKTLAQAFFCEFCKIFKDTFRYRIPLMAASVNISDVCFWFKFKRFQRI